MATSDHTHTDEASAGLLIDDLMKIYPDGTLAADDISFSIDAGDFCVIIGPSGCGESTTLHSLVGNMPSAKGTVTLDGRDITDVPTYRRDIGLIFQDLQLFPHFTVEENIRYGPERMDVFAAEADDHVAPIVEMMQLEGTLDRDLAELSADQQQRVALTRSLVLESKLFLLDESLGDMNYKLQKRMEWELLRFHRELGTTSVYVTHDQTQAMRLADQMIVTNDRQIEHSGPTGEAYNQPWTVFTVAFAGDSNLFPGTVTDVDAGGAVAAVDTDFGAFRVSTANADSKSENPVDRSVVSIIRPQFVRLEDGENSLDCDVDDVIHHSGEGI